MPIPIIISPQLENTPEKQWDKTKYYIPGIGTYYSVKNAVDKPTFGNILGAGLSGLGDILMLLGVGSFAKGASRLNIARQSFRNSEKALNEALKTRNTLYDKSILATKRASKARSAEQAITKLNGNASQIINYEKKAQAAEQAARDAQNAYNKISWEIDGSVPVNTKRIYEIPDMSKPGKISGTFIQNISDYKNTYNPTSYINNSERMWNTYKNAQEINDANRTGVIGMTLGNGLVHLLSENSKD